MTSGKPLSERRVVPRSRTVSEFHDFFSQSSSTQSNPPASRTRRVCLNGHLRLPQQLARASVECDFLFGQREARRGLSRQVGDIMADDESTATAFFCEVSAWNAEVRDEV